jgi:hypothetical protein
MATTTPPAPAVTLPRGTITHDQATGLHYYQMGPVKFEISVEKFSDALQQADNIGQGPAKEFMQAVGLPVEPWSFKYTRPVLLSFVQVDWHRFKATPEESLTLIVEKLKTRVNHYRDQIAELAKKPPKVEKAKVVRDAVRGGSTSGTGAAKVQGQVMRLRPDREDIWGKFTTGQKSVLVAKLKSLGQATSGDLAKALTEAGFTATQPVERVTAFYFAEWRRNGLIEAVEQAPNGEAPKPAEAKAPATPKPQPSKPSQAKTVLPKKE